MMAEFLFWCELFFYR